MRRLSALSQVRPWRVGQAEENFQFDYVFLIYSIVITMLAIFWFGIAGLFFTVIMIIMGVIAFFVSPILVVVFAENQYSHYLSGYMETYSPKWCGRGSNEDLLLGFVVTSSPMIAAGIFFWTSKITKARFAGWLVIMIAVLSTYGTKEYYEIRDRHIRENVCDLIIDRSFRKKP